ncbi:adhesive plaque matrix protein-like [Dreissena polymorpha]|uniref:adhesive plaque matrix protein-like n=1 Tax=Dreissena polymorpha TaxID=45954 RepID=UPI002263B88C|nr:adhesive plaque matrix protein-like [Dreissena polymorpha]
MGADVLIGEIDRSHRTGKPGGPQPRPILVKFVSYRARQKLYSLRRNLKTNKEHARVFINEDLTQRRAQLLFVARGLAKAKRIESAWSADGIVLIRVLENGESKLKRIASEFELEKEGHSIQNEYKQNRSLISESGKRAKAQIDSGHGLTYPRERRSLTQREQVKRPLIYKEEYSDPFPTYRKEQILHIPHPIERNYKPFDHREHLNIAHFPNAQEPPYFQNVHAQPTYFPRVQEKPTYVAKGHAPDPAFKREHVPDPYHQRKNVQHLSFQRKRLFNERKNVQRLSYPREHEKSPSHLIEKEKPPATQSTQVLIQSVRKGQVKHPPNLKEFVKSMPHPIKKEKRPAPQREQVLLRPSVKKEQVHIHLVV